MSNKDLADHLRARFQKAEGLWRASQPDKKNKVWQTAHCPKCGKKISYIPPDEGAFKLKCPRCNFEWVVKRLTDYG